MSARSHRWEFKHKFLCVIAVGGLLLRTEIIKALSTTTINFKKDGLYAIYDNYGSVGIIVSYSSLFANRTKVIAGESSSAITIKPILGGIDITSTSEYNRTFIIKPLSY